MTSVRAGILELVNIWIVHSVVELLLRQSFSFCTRPFTPEFVTWLVAYIWFAIDGLAGIWIDKPPACTSGSVRIYLATNSFPKVGSI